MGQEGQNQDEKPWGTIWDIAEVLKPEDGIQGVDAIKLDNILQKADVWPDGIDLGDFSDKTQDKMPGRFLFEIERVRNLVGLIMGKRTHGTIEEITRALNVETYQGTLTSERVLRYIREHDICPLTPLGEAARDPKEDHYDITVIAEGLAQKLIDKLKALPQEEGDDGIVIEETPSA